MLICAAAGALAGGLLLAGVRGPRRDVATDIDIAASPERVWAVLTDMASYPAWNPFIRQMTGSLRAGGRLTIRLAAGGTDAPRDQMVFSPHVIAVRPPRRLQWIGRLWGLPGLFTGEHVFILHPTDHGTRLEQNERFSGLLLWVYDVNPLHAAFQRMNAALKAEAERP
ncbi:SRPBCC domain-containing protein [Gluconacetobacter tumulisoli]|uniref:SRPBCC domain-containing protein n=1 Tax=Gluconacetobacter tumulisoli TaxID=1286189 RepID=A0A7W4PLI5_9PROT|nr:SRPBCC domain-containing protein [Gluconacetobacter tumulisoli]MBB2200679.1 SRPBCC domain-containing protein [Gluconacetobacter tumulisoli]